MDRVEQLASILKRLNQGEDKQKIAKEAKDFIANLDPVELSLAEQQLIDQGMEVEELRNLCAIHLEALDGELQKMMAEVEPGHVLHTLVLEHDEILRFLDELEELKNELSELSKYDPQNDKFEKLSELAENLISAEKHHQREEDVLFPELEGRDVTGPPRIMRMEHDLLRARKHKLLTLSNTVKDMDYEVFKAELKETAEYLVFNLRDHIFKENTILYPSAMELLVNNVDIWAELKDKCDEIGYCKFTPQG